MTAITTNSVMSGQAADRTPGAHAQGRAPDGQADALRFSDMMQAGKRPAQPSVGDPGRAPQAPEPAPDLGVSGARDEGTETSPRPGITDPGAEDETNPATMQATHPDIANEPDTAPHPAAREEEPATAAAAFAAPAPLPDRPGPDHRAAASGKKQQSSMPPRTGGTDGIPTPPKGEGFATPVHKLFETGSDHHATRTAALARPDIQLPAQAIASNAARARLTEISKNAPTRQQGTKEPLPIPGAERKAADMAGGQSGTPQVPGPERLVTSLRQPAVLPLLAATAESVLPATASNRSDRASLADPLGEFAALSGAETTTRDLRPSGPLIARHGPDLPQHIARQIAEFAPQPQQATEVRLNPEELGRVRMTMIQAEGAISVSITAERGETLDLMRRHIGLLAEEFRQIGYGSITFDFGPEGQRQGRGHPAPDEDPTHADAGQHPGAPERDAPPARALSAHIASGSIDIRL